MSDQDLNALYFAITSLKEARALLWDRVRGTNDRLYDLCKEYDLAIAKAETAYKNVQKFYHEYP